VAESGPRVLVLAWDDESDPNALSGMPWNMRQALESAGCRVVLGGIGTLQRTPAELRAMWRGWQRMRRLKTLARNTTEKMFPRIATGKLRHAAQAAARAADEEVARHSPDVVFGPCMSMPIGFMESDVPILYASDATAALICRTYDTFRDRGAAYRAAFIELETTTLARADRTVVASESTRQSAIQDHHADPEKVRVVPMGANVDNSLGEAVAIPASAPDRKGLDLLLVAADPERKRLDLCLRTVRELRRRGWHASLRYIGPNHPATGEPEVEWAGKLSLAASEDRKVHQRLLRECHLGIMPSTAEMFGIAPIESAAFGRPSLVSDTGGLPTVVLDGETGRVVPVDAPVEAWADAVLDMVEDPDRYQQLSRQAHRRYEDVLNWGAWGRTARGIIEEIV